MAVILHYFATIGTFEGELVTSHLLKLDPYCLRQKCSPKNLVFGNI